jgi:uncharacterized protein
MSERIRVVIDTNIFVSAAIGGGPPRRLLDHWFESPTFDVIACPHLCAELRDVLLGRPKLRRFVTVEVASVLIDTIEALVEMEADPVVIEPILRDPKDDYLVALARQSNAKYIVSGDKDLLEWESPIPPILTASAFLAMVEPGRPS